MVGARLIPTKSQRELQVEETNCGPRSEVIVLERRIEITRLTNKPLRNPQMKL